MPLLLIVVERKVLTDVSSLSHNLQAGGSPCFTAKCSGAKRRKKPRLIDSNENKERQLKRQTKGIRSIQHHRDSSAEVHRLIEKPGMLFTLGDVVNECSGFFSAGQVFGSADEA